MTLNKRHPMSRRFHLMRLVAEHIHADEQEGLLPSTDSVTSRQKFQRAFAQELLCPAQDLMEHLRIRPDSQDIPAPTEDDMLEAADRFGVSTVMVQSILIRKGILGPHVL
jgi:Zn-dependent peptidase ImmA (M78 family)